MLGGRDIGSARLAVMESATSLAFRIQFVELSRVATGIQLIVLVISVHRLRKRFAGLKAHELLCLYPDESDSNSFALV